MPPPPAPKPVNVMIDLNKRDFYAVIIGGFLLSANAGFINAATMIGLFSTTVSHVTGTTTRLGVTLVQNKWDSVLREASVLLSFMFGSFICGILIRNSKFRLTRRYGLALLVESFVLFLTTLLLYYQNYLAPHVAAFACGLQNGLTTGYSGAIIRTTHVTGTATDIGLIIGQNLLSEKRQDLWKLQVLVPLLVGYFLGGVIGTIVYEWIDYLSFLFPSTFVGAIGITQIIITACWDLQEEHSERDKRLARARARRAAKANHPPPEFEALIHEEPPAVTASEVGGAATIEMSAIVADPFADEGSIVPLVVEHDATPKRPASVPLDDDEEDDDEYDFDPRKPRP